MLKIVFRFLIVAIKELQLVNIKIVQLNCVVNSISKGYRKKIVEMFFYFLSTLQKPFPIFFEKINLTLERQFSSTLMKNIIKKSVTTITIKAVVLEKRTLVTLIF